MPDKPTDVKPESKDPFNEITNVKFYLYTQDDPTYPQE
jgi:hypothetical protein